LHRAQQSAYRDQLGLNGDPDSIFCIPDGEPWDPDAFSSAFAYRVAKCGLPRIGLQEPSLVRVDFPTCWDGIDDRVAGRRILA
ncbi:MAG TPA: hypothetical protein VMA36_09855, partial [Candidatus Limnocylindria bacterium]|nr:hypothetical protein [Candidatus Limnocylindria bacterium]